MELTPTERQLWDNFGEAVMGNLNKKIQELSKDDFNPMTVSVIIESTVDLFADTYCNIPHSGIGISRVNEIIRSEANMIKRKLNEKFFK